ncbi:unnamed protein product [Caenorhabditis brenneri]
MISFIYRNLATTSESKLDAVCILVRPQVFTFRIKALKKKGKKLSETASTTRIPFPEAATFEEVKTWKQVHVNNHKGDISVGVVNLAGGKQITAEIDVRNKSYGYGYQEKEVFARGPACASSVTVLCRRALPGYKLYG